MRFRLFPQDVEAVGCYRILYPYAHLEANGGHQSFFDLAAGWDGTGFIPLSMPYPAGPIPEGYDADVYVFQRPLWKIGPAVAEWLHQHGKTVVVETDDWYHGLPHNAPARDVINQRADLSLRAMDEMLKRADLVTVSTPELATAYGADHVLPNYLHWPTWQNIEPAYQQDRGRVRVGWMGWLKYRGADLQVLRGLIGPWLRKHPEVVFVSVGKPDVLDYLDIPAGQREHFEGDVFPGHAIPTSQIDIGLVPLEQTRFNECKSHLKGLEYAACGIPCIATPTGPYREWVDDGANGFLARKPRQWLRALEQMLEGDRWRVMGQAARVKAEQHTIGENWWRWENLYGGSLPSERSTVCTTATSGCSNAAPALAG